MKWFKHMSNSHRDKTLKGVFRKFGLEGEARFWRLIELMAEALENDDVSFDFELENLRESLRFRSLKDCRSFLDTLAILTGMIVEYSGNDCRINYDKLLEIKDNHTSNLQAKTKKAPSKLALEIEEEKEEELEIEEEKENKKFIVVTDSDTDYTHPLELDPDLVNRTGKEIKAGTPIVIKGLKYVPDENMREGDGIYLPEDFSIVEKITEIQEGLSKKIKKASSVKMFHPFNLESLYEEYPRKEGKKDGLKKLEKIVVSQEKYDEVLQAIRNYRAINILTETRYLKHFSSFVSNWEEYVVANLGNSKSPTPVTDHVINQRLNNPYKGKNNE